MGDYTFNLAKSLIKEPGIGVGVLTSTLAKGAELIDGVEVFPVMERWSLVEMLKVVRLIKNWSPDIVHIQYPTQGYSNGWLPWLLP